jgi:antitoxin (DNA-binding transcriptional repressor) of toxin-antitoxin stability system
MKTIGISEFQKRRHKVLDTVRKTGEPVLVTRYGVPLCEVHPPQVERKSSFGCMAGTTKVIGDILEPLPESDWKVLR